MPKITKILIVAFFSLLIVLSGEITNVKAADPVCQMTFGSVCSVGGERGFCYGGRCETEEALRGQSCGTLGGTCVNGVTGCTGSDKIWDTTGGGRDCAALDECCVDKVNPHPDICVNVSNGTQLTNLDDQYCYNNGIVPDTSGSVGDPCGTEINAICYDTSFLSPLDGCDDLDLDNDGTDDGLQRGTGGRNCGIGKQCCYSLGDQVGGGIGTGGNNFVFVQNEIPRKTCAGTQPEEGIAGGFAFFKKAIIPCGRKCDDGNTSLNEMEDCTLCHFIILGKNIYDLLLALLILAAILFVTIGGVLYMISGANPSLNGLAKTIITKTLFGFILFLASWMIVFTILKMLSYNTSFLGSGGEWWSITCETEGALDIHED